MVPSIEIKILAVGENYSDADALGKSVASQLNATYGTWGSVVVRGCFVTEVSEVYEVDSDMESVLYYAKQITLKVVYED